MSAFGGSYISDVFNVEGQAQFSVPGEMLETLHHERIEIWSAHLHAEGMRGYCLPLDNAVLCVYGDRLSSAAPAPDSSDISQILAWCRNSFLRFSGGLCYQDRLVLWTDEIASCPLFYAFHESGEPVFASEAKRLLRALPQPVQFSGLFGFRPLPAIGTTIFSNVYSVPAGSVLTLIRDGGSKWRKKSTRTFFQLAHDPKITSIDDARLQLAEALNDSVLRATRGLDEACITLSGGVDSSSVASLMRSEVKRINSYTVGTCYGNEFEPAREVASFIQSRHHELLMTANDLEALLPELIWSMETWDPLTLQIAAPVAFLYQQLATESQVFLTGYGADLIFAGTLDVNAPEATLERRIREQLIFTAPTNELSPVFPSRYGITVRYPFLTAEVLTAGLMIRARLKVHRGIEKFVLRSAVEPFLPKKVAWRPKLGIHEGSAMHKLFTEVLGEFTEVGQMRALTLLAADVLLRSAPRPSDSGQSREMELCAYY